MSPTPRLPVQPLFAGALAAFVGFASTFAVVVAGFRSVGAGPEEAASGLFAVTFGMGAMTLALSLSRRLPIAVAWSTPGSALLVATGPLAGGYPAAEGERAAGRPLPTTIVPPGVDTERFRPS